MTGNAINGLPGRIVVRILPKDGHWLWQGSISPEGYARLNSVYVHRIVCEWAHGPIPEGYDVDHLCRVKSCVHPDHLEAVTHRENMLRARTGICKHGHSLDEYGKVQKDGTRYCGECRRQNQKRAYDAGEWPSMIAKKHNLYRNPKPGYPNPPRKDKSA